jgi:hypothetical protein
MSLFKNTIGQAIIVETGQTMASATGIKFIVNKPNGKAVEWSNITVHGTTQLKYITVAGDLDQDGWYRIYPTLTVGSWTGTGEPNRFLVKDPNNPDKSYRM